MVFYNECDISWAKTVLGCNGSDITLQQLHSLYKKLCKQYHPDVNQEKSTQEQMKNINIAYSIMKIVLGPVTPESVFEIVKSFVCKYFGDGYSRVKNMDEDLPDFIDYDDYGNPESYSLEYLLLMRDIEKYYLVSKPIPDSVQRFGDIVTHVCAEKGVKCNWNCQDKYYDKQHKYIESGKNDSHAQKVEEHKIHRYNSLLNRVFRKIFHKSY